MGVTKDTVSKYFKFHRSRQPFAFSHSILLNIATYFKPTTSDLYQHCFTLPTKDDEKCWSTHSVCCSIFVLLYVIFTVYFIHCLHFVEALGHQLELGTSQQGWHTPCCTGQDWDSVCVSK